MSIPGAGSSFDRIREETAVWKEQMERIVKIENYYREDIAMKIKRLSSVLIFLGLSVVAFGQNIFPKMIYIISRKIKIRL